MFDRIDCLNYFVISHYHMKLILSEFSIDVNLYVRSYGCFYHIIGLQMENPKLYEKLLSLVFVYFVGIIITL